ncbi:hypothetical protein DFH09DRAFT_477110 [Mycena vulgaris]|nr:hypothetical protein DFH09DRAFT_477110 [Mycena vulgaris]
MPPATRPATIAELATLAQSDPDAASFSAHDLKHYMRRALDTHRRTGQALASGGGGGPTASNRGGTADAGTDLERAFVEHVRATTLIVEKIPEHAGFASGLTVEQRANLKVVSQFSLLSLSLLRRGEHSYALRRFTTRWCHPGRQ